MVHSETNRKNFVDTSAQFLIKHGFDGLDME